NGVDDVRDLRDKINFSPSQGQFKIYIIDEVHMLSTPAFNALLKTLEEPPPHAIFILATTEIHKIPATVLSRCQRHEFRRVPVESIIRQLDLIAKGENLTVEPAAAQLIARQASGGMRDAISLLDQLASTGETITLELAQTVLGTATNETVLELVDALRDNAPAAGLQAIHRALDAGSDPRALARQIVDYLRGLMLFQLGNQAQVDATATVKERMAAHAKDFSSAAVLRMMRVFNTAAVSQHGGWQPSLNLELALAEVLSAGDETLSAPRAVDGRQAAPKPTAKRTQAPRPASAKQTVSKPRVASAHARTDASVPVVETNAVVTAWPDIRRHVKKTAPNLEALLNSCKSLQVQGGTLVLGLASEVLVEKIKKPDQIEIARKAIADVLGAELDIRCVVIPGSGKVPPNVNQNGLVAAAIQAGGKIAEIQE
ncbi:MAG: DNA polymerase III subunit gamma/tau, partial [Anaerolineales bacterium]|nr:DNA polymerase III subunit gamma/tau [Anaerolineales bacterium]